MTNNPMPDVIFAGYDNLEKYPCIWQEEQDAGFEKYKSKLNLGLVLANNKNISVLFVENNIFNTFINENNEVVNFEHFETELERSLTRIKIADKWKTRKYRK